jgi:signal transduction histidine kinase
MRIAQEATTNAVRHAKASKIVISLSYQPKELVMRICDDGIGFDQNTVMNIDQGHFGLRGLRSRVKRLNAELEISSGMGTGTQITVRINA